MLTRYFCAQKGARRPANVRSNWSCQSCHHIHIRMSERSMHNISKGISEYFLSNTFYINRISSISLKKVSESRKSYFYAFHVCGEPAGSQLAEQEKDSFALQGPNHRSLTCFFLWIRINKAPPWNTALGYLHTFIFWTHRTEGTDLCRLWLLFIHLLHMATYLYFCITSLWVGNNNIFTYKNSSGNGLLKKKDVDYYFSCSMHLAGTLQLRLYLCFLLCGAKNGTDSCCTHHTGGSLCLRFRVCWWRHKCSCRNLRQTRWKTSTSTAIRCSQSLCCRSR